MGDPRLFPLRAVMAAIVVATLGAPSKASSDADIRRSIEAAAAQDPRLEHARVAARVTGGEVVLFGEVHLYRQKMLFEQIAWRVAGVAEVDNEIRVEPIHPLAAAEIERAVRHILKDYPRFHGSGISVRVAQGHVHISGVFGEPSDVLFLKHQVADIEGVVGIAIAPRFKV